MATKKSGWEAWNAKNSKNTQKQIKKTLKKTNKAYIIIAVIAFLVGFAGAWIGLDRLCINDKFELNGQQIITYKEGEAFSYKDEGINYVSMGRDRSADVIVETKLLQKNGELAPENYGIGEYSIVYRAVGGRCDGQTLYRVIRIVPADSEQ